MECHSCLVISAVLGVLLTVVVDLSVVIDLSVVVDLQPKLEPAG